MVIIIRIAAVLGAIWSMIVLGVLATLGTLVSFFGLFDRTHTYAFIFNTIGLEIVLLCALWQAGKLRLKAAPVMLVWFCAFSALIDTPFILRDWPRLLWGTLVYMLPVTLTMLLLTLHGVAGYFKTRHDSRQQAAVTPQPL